MATPGKEKNVTVRGRLSFPKFTHAEAVALASTSKFNSGLPPEKIASSFDLLLEPSQLQKIIDHITDVYLPYVADRHKAGEKRDALDPKTVAKIKKFLEAGDWSDQPPFMPIKEIKPKYADQTPECVARLQVKGPQGGDVTLKARVENETQLVVPDPDLLSFPTIQPLSSTIFEMYPGAYVATTLNLYSFENSSSNYGIGAGASTAVYMGNLEGERLGGGGGLDEDDIFADD